MTGGPEPGGLLVVDKPGGLTSHDVVARVRRLAGTRRVGHGGTLDPMATGVLVVAVDWSTRLLTLVSGHDKEYRATVRLGAATVTDDAEGDVVSTADATGLDMVEVRRAADRLVGDVEQVPSAVSAVKVDGRRSYARVRAGEDVQLAARPVHVARLDVGGGVARDDVLSGVLDVDVVCEVSAGTYVRALARDLGAALGVGGHLTALRRTRSGPFTEAEAVPLADLDPARRPAADVGPPGEAPPATAAEHSAGTSALRARLVDPASAVARFLPVRRVDAETVRRLRHGQRPAALGTGEPRLGVLNPSGDLVAIVDDSGSRVRATLVRPP